MEMLERKVLFADDVDLFHAIDAITVPHADVFQALVVTWDRDERRYALCVDVKVTVGKGQTMHGMTASCAGSVVVQEYPYLGAPDDGAALSMLRKDASDLTKRLRDWYPEVKKQLQAYR